MSLICCVHTQTSIHTLIRNQCDYNQEAFIFFVYSVVIDQGSDVKGRSSVSTTARQKEGRVLM